jgi:hypothetical protein
VWPAEAVYVAFLIGDTITICRGSSLGVNQAWGASVMWSDRIGLVLLASALFITNAAKCDPVFDAGVIRDLKTGYFERTYKGKPFSDTGSVDMFSLSSQLQPFIQMKRDLNAVWCGLDEATYERFQHLYPVGTAIRMGGIMQEWHLKDHTLLLKDQCNINHAPTGQSFDMKVIDDLNDGYFGRTYNGKEFSDAGVVVRYLQRLFAFRWYVDINSQNEDVWCYISDATHDRMEKDFPSGTKVRVMGKMKWWDLNDDSLELEDECSVVRQ